MIDNYTHENNNIIYVIESIPGPKESSQEYDEIINNFNSQLTDHCLCQQSCLKNECRCLEKLKTTNYVPYIKNKHMSVLNLDNGELSSNIIIECNDLCSCSNECGNRVVQKGPIEGLNIKKCQDEAKGLGLFSECHLPKGMFVCEYAGEVITKSEAIMRHQMNAAQNKMNYILCLQEHSAGNLLQWFVDPSKFGNIGRYINHSCEPNCCIIPVRVNTPIPKLAIFTCSDILPNTEITFDYGSFNNDNISENINRSKCLCNSKNCMEWMPYHVY
ncbi:histone-lysine N-methyltransferase SETMAR [Achroia grisella]|uniref:histone-lysine N-methyltransferase SETMAR n=1 Tax=Achroia grisella TaxID=688607 RepID=UPI0027D237FF|nr:histone-lysine N-methyltransferase SETMAR [Achroia grisella]XP_059049513.1 histone-lysine N-methyltransferase SETMAR [Achroia grisella]